MPHRHWCERLLWTAITIGAVWAALNLSLGQLQRYNDNPTVVTLEKDYRRWQYSLPAITLCPGNRTDPIKMVKAIKKRWNLGPDDKRYPYYANFVLAVANSDLFHLQEYEKYKDDDSLDVDLFELAVEVMPEFLMKISASQPVTYKWVPVMTESGTCYVTNSVATADLALIKLHPNSTHQPITCHYSDSVCYVIFEVTKTSYYHIHSPYDVAKMSDRTGKVYPSLNRFIELTVTETRTGHGVRELSSRRRACLYHDESEEGRQVYSTQMCRLSCRSRLALKLCGCRPFYYFYEAGPFCNPKGMWCLSQYSKVLANFGGIKCNCQASCLHAEFKEKFVEDKIWGKGPFQDRGALRLSVEAPRTRYTREIVFHFEDLVVSFGGAAGLFLGASFISFVEIIYFAMEKLFKFFSREEEIQPVIKQKRPYEERLEEIEIMLKSLNSRQIS
ncbi:pickpocket protein 19 isoform X1 [Pieris rapae]|uniref:pickpocket protein 19 isoform X1 n=1 Tax=Pieris rapae TaxID=64459 RepID=UPI001E280F0D|nr:pickpocket protein 19 isoform X1 [Pieris rapae]